ncbi:aminoglycoside phosphotransferase family protein [Saccharopolyspora shandongensis]|uniref:aminoglycoside phosphotransferase family protein n=1 Tax=Saccharopolyspora shandongensis TaxID=418495 RepID=UPI003413E227
MGNTEREPAEVLSLLGREHDLRLRIVRQFERGDEGAYEVVNSDGQRMVLKWLPWGPEAEHAADVVEPALARLRDRGIPIPARVAAGRAGDLWFELQEFADGAPVEYVDNDLLDRLVEVVDVQRGVGLGTGKDWWEFIVDGLRHDRSPLCRPSALQGCTGAVAELVKRLRAAAHSAPLPDRVPGDLVHFDFGPANVLVDAGRVTAVLDWQSCRDGDASYDLVTTDWDLATWPKSAPGVSDRLGETIIRTTHPGAVVVYAAHSVLRNLTWASGTEWEDHIVRAGHAFLDRWSRV